jgi:hypothetical protein
MLACIHGVTLLHLHACARRLRRHFTTRGLFLITLDLRSDPGADDEGLPPSPGAIAWAEDQMVRLDSLYLR